MKRKCDRPAFEGRLRNSISSTNGFRPFAYEISIATHLMQKGWDVEFADYARHGARPRNDVRPIPVLVRPRSQREQNIWRSVGARMTMSG